MSVVCLRGMMGPCNLQISAILAYTLHKVEMGLVNFFEKLQVKVQVTVIVMDKQDKEYLLIVITTHVF